jgi:hypothetical protein
MMMISHASNSYHSAGVDNRDSQEMYSYLEARIEAVKRRVAELERENEMLRSKLSSASGGQADFRSLVS